MVEPLEQRIAPASLIFAKQLANYSQAGNLVATDAQGNILVAGVFDSSLDVDLGPGVTSLTPSDTTDGDVYIIKYQPDGTLVWAQKWGGEGSEQPTAIAADAIGNVFVTGTFLSSLAGIGGPGTMTTTGGRDVFLIKLNSADGTASTAFDGDGQMKFGGTLNDSASSLALDGSGRVLVGGNFASNDAGYNGTGTIQAGSAPAGFIFRVGASDGVPDSNFGVSGYSLIGPQLFPGQSTVTHVLIAGNGDIYAGIINPTTSSHGIYKFLGSDGSPNSLFTTISIPVPTVDDGNFGLALDRSARLITSDLRETSGLTIAAYQTQTGQPDSTFGGGLGSILVSSGGGSFGTSVLLTDSHSNIIVGGVLSAPNADYFLRVDQSGSGREFGTFGKPHDPALVNFEMGMAIDPLDNVIFRGTYATGADLDPTNGTTKLVPRKDVLAAPNLIEGFLTKIDSYGVDAKNPFFFVDQKGSAIKVTVDGAGRGHYRLVGDALNFQNLDTLELFDTDLTTKVAIGFKNKPVQDTIVNHIITHGTNQHVGSINLASFVLLGDKVNDAIPELRVTGKLNLLTVDGLNDYAFLKLGEGLPYNVVGEDKTPDTYNNHPDLTVGFVLGPGVIVDVTGDGTPGGVGGGGLGKVTFGGWGYPGGIVRTTQSIGSFTILNGDFNGILEVDKFHVGESTQADVGTMSVPNGSWGGTGTEIEGDVKAFSAEAFLAGATIQAGSIGKVNITQGAFDGTLVLTDPDASAVPTYTVTTNFTGSVVSASSIKKLVIKGDFTGSLTAPSIGAITAYSFLGTAGVTEINATLGSLGLITSKSGVISDYTITTDTAFSGFSVKLGKLTADTIGVNNVHITAASIGNITVSLAADPKSAGVDLIGIKDSTFVTTATGNTKGNIGNIGKVSVTLTGAVAGTSATGIQSSTFDARVLVNEFVTSPASTVNALGDISVKISGSGGGSLGIKQSNFQGDTIGALKVSSSLKGPNGTSRDIDTATLTATNSIKALSFDGDATMPQVDGLKVWAGGGVGNVTVKAKTAANGTLLNSDILAGQSLALNGATDKDQLKALKAAGLGAVSLSGSLSFSKLVAGGSIGAITASGDVGDSLVIAGAMLGDDFAIDGNETYQRVAAIGSVTVKGAFARTSVAAGINPGDGVFGNGDDTLAAVVNFLSTSSSIGAISLSAGAAGTPGIDHQYAIQAAEIKGAKVAGVAAAAFPLFIDLGATGEDAAEVLVRVLA